MIAALFCSLAASALAAAAPADPKEVLGYELGEKFSDYARLSRFVDAVTADHPRAIASTYGRSAEGRELRTIVVSSEENVARLREIREGIALLADPRRLPPGEATDESLVLRRIESLPVVVWLSFGVHGDESSSTEAAMMLLRRLLTATDEETGRFLRETVVVVDPCLNPDGRERYVSWFNTVVGAVPNPDPQSREHRQPWPGGRYNHWLFDLNRDWAFLTQEETRARVAAYLEWTPQVHVDFHEMFPESSYFFFPAEAPINRHLPASTLRWAKAFGAGNARAFDRHGWAYYTGEQFDLYYPGYGDSWPSFQGAIGMTYEQGGHGVAGLAYTRRDGTLLTLKDRVEHHFTAALATIETAAANRRGLLLDFHRFRRDAIEDGRRGSVAEYLLVPRDDPGRAADLAEILLRQGIEVRRALRPFVAEKLLRYDRSRIERESFPEGTFLVSPEQPLRGLVTTLLDPETRADVASFYDISAWSLPLAFGIEAYVAEAPVTAESEPVTGRPNVAGGIEGNRSSVAYLLPWTTDAAARVLARAGREGFRARLATREFTLGGRDYGRGTVVFFARANPETLHDRLAAIAAEEGALVRSAGSSLTEKGIDLGSEHVVPLAAPRIAVLAGEGVDPTAFGTVWFLLSLGARLDPTALPLSSIGSADLSRYDVLVAPDGGGYAGALSDPAVAGLKAWVEAGGVLVGIEGGAVALGAEGKKLVSVSSAPDEKAPPAEPAAADREPSRPPKIEERLDLDRRDAIPGTMLDVDLDPAHPLAFGYPSGVTILKRGDLSFRTGGVFEFVGTFLPRAVSGYIRPERSEELARRGYLVDVRLGRGHVVLFADDPNFRMIFRGLTRLFLNAVLLLPRPAAG